MPLVRLSPFNSFTSPSFILTAAIPTMPKHSTAVEPAYWATTSLEIDTLPNLLFNIPFISSLHTATCILRNLRESTAESPRSQTFLALWKIISHIICEFRFNHVYIILSKLK